LKYFVINKICNIMSRNYLIKPYIWIITKMAVVVMVLMMMMMMMMVGVLRPLLYTW